MSEFTRSIACNAEESKNGEPIEEALRTLNANMAMLAQKLDALAGSIEEKDATHCTDSTELNMENKEQVE